MLISATPLNNRPAGIVNQIYLFQDSKDSFLEVSNLQYFFRQRIDRFEKLKNEPNISLVQEAIKDIYADIREKVIKPLTIRLTRTDLKSTNYIPKALLGKASFYRYSKTTQNNIPFRS